MNRDAPSPGGRTRTILLVALAAGQTQEQAAKAAKISRSTLVRRLANDPAFRVELAELRASMLDACVGVLSSHAAAAAIRIAELANSTDEPVALAACRTVIESVLKLRHELELAARLEAVERALAERELAPLAPPLRGVP